MYQIADNHSNKLIITPTSVTTFQELKRINDSTRNANSTVVEKEAQFNGGPKGYKKYLMNNLKVPDNLYKAGTVCLSLIINKDGKVEDVHLLRSLQYAADKEALRVITNMPAWKPAVQNNKNVYYQAIQNITFTAG